ncbi:MAG: hypothetical protein U0163_15360 [Gemmatimonadaceae bacterium]
MSMTFDPAALSRRQCMGRAGAVSPIIVRRLDLRHSESWGEGLPYIYERATISADGLTWTSEARMRSPMGPEYTDVDVWEKQVGR